MTIEYKLEKGIADADLRPLYESAGWTSYTEKFPDLQVLLAPCQIVYSAWDGQQLVGLIRCVGDGVSIQYVQDLLVLPAYQGKGIGTRLLKYVMEQSRDIRQFVLITDGSPANQPILEWYAHLGLTPFETRHIKGLLR